MESVNPDAWIYTLTRDHLREQAALRRLNTEGTLQALRARVSRYERALRGENPPPSPAVEMPPPDFIETDDKAKERETNTISLTNAENLIPEYELSSREPGGHARSDPNISTRIPLRTSDRLLSGPEVGHWGEEYLRAPPQRERYNLPPHRAVDSRYAPVELSTSEACREMRRWNIGFSGVRGSDAEAFLIRIREGRRIAPISDADLFKCLPFFLTGIALHWFRAKEGSWLSWREFESAWHIRFGDSDFQFALRDEIRGRTQGEHESVADYLTNLTAMFRRLDPPWSMPEQVNYAHRNMLPRLQIAVHRDDIVDLDTLEILAMRIERSYLTASQYRPPPPPERTVCPDLAYRPPPRSMRSTVAMTATEMPGDALSRGEAVEEAVRDRPPAPPPRSRPAAPTPQRRSTDPTSQTSSPREGRGNGRMPSRPPNQAARPAEPTTGSSSGDVVALTCWNCGKKGHFSRNCRGSPRIHCYRCGKANVTVRACPDCSGNGGRRS